MRFLNFFSAQHDRLVLGFVMSTKIFEFRPYLCLWQLFKEGTRQQIFTDFEPPFSNDHISGWTGLFQKFQSLELIVWSALAIENRPRSIATQKVEQ